MSDFDPKLLVRDFPTAFHPSLQYDGIYWTIELEDLGESPAYGCLDPFTKLFLGWVAQRVENSLSLPDHDIHLTVIEVEYVSRYPCLAAFTSKRDSRGGSVISEETAYSILCEIRAMLSKTTVSEMMRQIPWETLNTIKREVE